jgi:hypothetical protein
MAIAGIEGLAQGFMQGMAIKRQNDRQDVLDAQNLERFGMDKERFATQQAASAFDLQNAQTNAANAATDRTRALGIQKKGDAFHDGMSKIVGAFENGDMNGGYKALEQTTNTTGIGKGRFKSDASGNVMLDAKGNATWENLDANGNVVGKPVITDHKSAVDRIANAFNPEKYHDSQVATAAEIAKEDRAAKTKKAEDLLNHSQAMELARLNNNARDGNIKLQLDYKDKQAKAAEIELFTPHVETARRIFGNKKITGEQLAATVKATTKEKFIKSGIDTFDLANKKLTPEQRREAHTIITQFGDTLYGTGSTATSSTDTYDSTSQGRLVPIGLEGESGAIELNDRQPVSVEKPSSSAAKTASPVSRLTVRPPAQAQEKTEVAIPAKPVKKVQVLTKISGIHNYKKETKINNPYQEIQGKYGDPIPDGFKRKSSYGDIYGKEYNTFVSNNYQD